MCIKHISTCKIKAFHIKLERAVSGNCHFEMPEFQMHIVSESVVSEFFFLMSVFMESSSAQGEVSMKKILAAGNRACCRLLHTNQIWKVFWFPAEPKEYMH